MPASQAQDEPSITVAQEATVTVTALPELKPTEIVGTDSIVNDDSSNEGVEETAIGTTTPSVTIQPEPAQPLAEPIEVTYFTPPQGEGPYYPIDKLDDRDNDLTVLEGSNETPIGQIVEFDGVVYDANGMPQPGVLIEIWQTDASGVYLHPGDPGTEQRDPNFQFYGEAITAVDGSYDFRTILPGHYEPRPRHIHVKVKHNDRELLTTQFYFEGDPELAGESMFNRVGGQGEHLIIALEEAQDSNGSSILVGKRDLVLNIDLSSE